MDNLERGQGENLVVVYQAPDEFIANMIKGFLEDDGIPVVLESRMAAMYDGALKMGEGYWGDVVVPEQYAERSKKLIEEYHSQTVDEDLDDKEGSNE